MPYRSSGLEREEIGNESRGLVPHTLMLLQFGLDGVVFVCVGIGLPRVSLQSGYSFDRSLCFPVGGGGGGCGGGGGGR